MLLRDMAPTTEHNRVLCDTAQWLIIVHLYKQDFPPLSNVSYLNQDFFSFQEQKDDSKDG